MFPSPTSTPGCMSHATSDVLRSPAAEGSKTTRRAPFCAKALLSLVAVLGLPGAASAANLLTNGSFDAGTFTGGSFGFPLAEQLLPGSTVLPGWTVAGNELAWFQTGQAGIATQNGSYALDLTGFCDLGTACPSTSVFASLTQTLSTVAGATYRLSFYAGTYAFNAIGPSIVATAGATTQSWALPGGGAPASGTWQLLGFDFVATGASTPISFGLSANLASGAPSYLGLDNVSVELVSLPIPEPGTYVLMLAGLGAVGFMARRRQA